MTTRLDQTVCFLPGRDGGIHDAAGEIRHLFSRFRNGHRAETFELLAVQEKGTRGRSAGLRRVPSFGISSSVYQIGLNDNRLLVVLSNEGIQKAFRLHHACCPPDAFKKCEHLLDLQAPGLADRLEPSAAVSAKAISSAADSDDAPEGPSRESRVSSKGRPDCWISPLLSGSPGSPGRSHSGPH